MAWRTEILCRKMHINPDGVNPPVQEAHSHLASEAGICLEASLQSLLNIYPPIYPCLVRDVLPGPNYLELSMVKERFCSADVIWQKML